MINLCGVILSGLIIVGAWEGSAWPRAVQDSVMAQNDAAQAPRDVVPPLGLVNAVCRPTIEVDAKGRSSGTAFVLATDRRTPGALLVMAHHLLGMPKSVDGAIPWNEAPLRASSATCRGLSGTTTWRTGAAFAIEGAHVLGNLQSLRDIAIFPITVEPKGSSPMPARLRLARNEPVSGTAVWLVAQTNDSRRLGQRFYRARVIQGVGYLAFVYDDADLSLSNTSGAPIVNASGDVVGVNVAVAAQNGELIGIADNLATIRLATALSIGLK